MTETDVDEFMVEEYLTRKTRNRLLALFHKHGRNDSRADSDDVVYSVHSSAGEEVAYNVHIQSVNDSSESSCDCADWN